MDEQRKHAILLAAAHPDDLPRAVDWVQTTWAALSKSPGGAVPKPPWER